MRPSPRRSAAVTVACLAGALLVGLPGPTPALARSAANPDDQPTAGTLPPGTDTVRTDDRAHDRPSGDVSSPSAIRSSTSVVPDGKSTRTNPMDHLSKPFRSSREN
ncbi:MAG: hypothetical protein PGN25_02670 [Methylorubrum populi]